MCFMPTPIAHGSTAFIINARFTVMARRNPLPESASRHLPWNRHQSLEKSCIVSRLNAPLEILRPHI